MSRRGGTRTRAVRKPVVVLAGEDRNDRESLRILLEAWCPHMRGRIVQVSDSVRLRGANENNLRQRVTTLARKIRARAQREKADLACVFVHEDLDAPDGEEYPTVRTRIERELQAHLGTAHYVLAVAELEAWLLLFPTALEQFVATWQVPQRRRGTDTSRIADPKEVLMGEVSRGGKRRYTESDAPDLFQRIVDNGHLAGPCGSNRSWQRFLTDADECGQSHVRHGSR